METLKQKAQALWVMFFKSDTFMTLERAYGCSECPFAEEHKEWGERPNPADPDEGYYDCHLLHQEKIWGENPRCTSEDWRNRVAEEVEAIAEYPIQQEIVEEKAAVLLYKFSRALQDESSGDLTINQIKERLFAGVHPRVIHAFNIKIRPMGGI